MGLHKTDLIIINRSFWPIYPVIGEALLRFAEQQGRNSDVGVIMQDHAGIKAHLAKHQRGQSVEFYPCKAWSASNSGVWLRIVDAIFFMCWVLFSLLWTRPAKVYVSTDPPVVVPFIVMLYARIFRAQYVYHLQDIHPEAANVVIPVNKIVYSILRSLDSWTMRNADTLITISDEMAFEIRERSKTQSKIHVLSNPAVSFDSVDAPASKKKGFTFCGNAGRLQRIPLVVEAITAYLEKGGSLEFVFAGGGVYSAMLEDLSQKFSNVTYIGIVPADAAAQINAEYEWALLPIEDEVTRYAFPSKSSSYVFSGALVAAICGKDTSVAGWVAQNNLGVVLAPDVEQITEFFFKVEHSELDYHSFDMDRSDLKKVLAFDYFIEQLNCLVVGGSA